MIVCICHGISDRELRSLIQQGASSVRDISTQCRAGTDCGACVREIRQMTAANKHKTSRES